MMGVVAVSTTPPITQQQTVPLGKKSPHSRASPFDRRHWKCTRCRSNQSTTAQTTSADCPTTRPHSGQTQQQCTSKHRTQSMHHSTEESIVRVKLHPQTPTHWQKRPLADKSEENPLQVRNPSQCEETRVKRVGTKPFEKNAYASQANTSLYMRGKVGAS